MAEIFKSYRKESKKDWGLNLPEEQKVSAEQIALGAQLRMADAIEKMARPYVDLHSTLDRYKNYYNNHLEEIKTLTKSRDAYKGKYNSAKQSAELLRQNVYAELMLRDRAKKVLSNFLEAHPGLYGAYEPELQELKDLLDGKGGENND